MNLINILHIFIKNIIPSMFPIIFITNYIKYKIIPSTNNKYIKYISLIFSYAPSNSLISTNNNEIIYSTIINPLFSYVVLINYFKTYETILIILINIIIHYTFLYFNLDNKSINITNKNINYIIKETTLSIINILGVIILFNILISLFNIFINNKLLFFLEISNGFNIISSINNILIRKILFIFLNSFGGIAIYFQIKSINNDASYFIIYKKFIISVIVTILTIMILECL